jgi:uncharacterized cupredoxin-like copper-binding protein
MGFVLLAGCCATLISLLPGVLARPAGAGTRVTLITVTAGKPSELAFKLSKSSIPATGTVTFKVTNAGTLSHDFKVCTTPSATVAKNACVGKVTKMLRHGQSAILTVAFTKKGSFEYLCTVPGHAGAGMKGLFGVASKPATVSNPVTTPTPTTTTTPVALPPPPATETLIGDPVNGATVFASAGCGTCHTLAAARATGVIGPSLDSLARQLTQALIVTQVTNGGQTMPSFAQSLTATQINDLAAYVYKSTHA